MEAFGKQHNETQETADASLLNTPNTSSAKSQSKGSSILESDLNKSLDQSLVSKSPRAGASSAASSSEPADDHDHAPTTNGQITHMSLDGVQPAKTLNASRSSNAKSGFDLLKQLGSNPGDILNPGGGKNTVIGSGKSDIIFGDGEGFNTITTGGGTDAIVFGKETTNRIFDFDPAKDKIVLTDGLNPGNIILAQGKNPGKGGLDQPTDSVNNALILDKVGGHILGALTFTKAESLSEKNFVTVDSKISDFVKNDSRIAAGFKTQQGSGQLNGTLGKDKLVGGGGDDFLYVGDDGFKIGTATGSGPREFPFPNDSPGISEATAELKGGEFRINGKYQNFDAAPLFSQGEKTIDPKATILNGSDPQALIDGFLKVPRDKEGNALSGTHMHFSPSEDSRGNFADATVIRYLKETPTDDKSGTISGQFKLNSEEQAAFLAGNLYVNLHTNVDVDGDGKAGFPTGENRLNFNQNVVKLV